MECLDANLAVKWYKPGELHGEEALKLLRRARKRKNRYAANEWILLEVTRALNKAGYDKEKIRLAHESLTTFFECEAIQKIPVSPVLDEAQNLMIEYNLHAADAIHLATALHTKSTIFWTEDEHLHKKTIKDYAQTKGLEIRKLGRM